MAADPNSHQDFTRSLQALALNERPVQLWTINSRKDILDLVHKRELNAQSTYFQRHFLEAHAAQPRLWDYGDGNITFDGSLEQVNVMVQTSNGLTHANFLLTGGSGGVLGVCITTGANDSWGELLLPRQCLTSNPKLDERMGTTLPKVFLKSWDIGCSGDITYIKALERHPDLCFQRFMYPFLIYCIYSLSYGSHIFYNNLSVTSSGWGEGGGSLQVMQLDGQDQTLSRVRRCTSDYEFWWVADCNDDSTKACIGTTRGVRIIDIESGSMTWICQRKNDCLSQKYLGDIVYAGFRNGLIYPLDIRSSLSADKVEGSLHSTAIRMGSAVCSLDILPLDDRYLLASAMKNQICLWDLRMTTKAVQYFEGHKNTDLELRMAVDPTGMLFASGGEDNAVRIWSVQSGRLLHSQRGCSCRLSRRPDHRMSVCWHTSYYGGRNGAIREFCYEDDHAWSLWVGSFHGLFLMHGAAT